LKVNEDGKKKKEKVCIKELPEQTPLSNLEPIINETNPPLKHMS